MLIAWCVRNAALVRAVVGLVLAVSLTACAGGKGLPLEAKERHAPREESAAPALDSSVPVAPPAATATPSHATAKVPVDLDDPTEGSPTAPVTLVMIGDYRCPLCAGVEKTIAQLKSAYAGRLRLVWKHNPFHIYQDARPAHEAAVAVHTVGGNAAFWRFHRLAFEHRDALTADNLKRWVMGAGVQGAAVEAELRSGRPAEKVEKDIELARTIGAHGNPSFRINGQEVSGAQPFGEFEKVIERELTEAAKLATSGTPAEEVYARRVEANYQPTLPHLEPDEAAKEGDVVWKIPVAADDPTQGPQHALVTVVVWSDFQCEPSAR